MRTGTAQAEQLMNPAKSMVQAIILLLGGVVSVAAVMVRVPGHAGAVVQQAH